MLNLLTVFDDAIASMQDHSNLLSVAPLPATVFLLQRDVINHYRYALTHYFPLELTEPFLQNSSVGTPYEKWAKFTNEDFDCLAFAISNLVRYTSRLVHDTTCKAMEESRSYSDMKALSNSYTGPICEFRQAGGSVGVRINADETLTITSFATYPSPDATVAMTSTDGGPLEYFRVTTDSSGQEARQAIGSEEYQELTRVLRGKERRIQDRSVVQSLKKEGLSEVEELAERNHLFGAACRGIDHQKSVFSPFDSLHESWSM
ncbi:MAG: hypothetical protein AAF266_07025 [Planctomycetota bacterium]